MDPGVMILFMIFGGSISAAIASSKRRNVFGYLILGALFPLIGIIVIACQPTLPALQAGEKTQPGY